MGRRKKSGSKRGVCVRAQGLKIPDKSENRRAQEFWPSASHLSASVVRVSKDYGGQRAENMGPGELTSRLTFTPDLVMLPINRGFVSRKETLQLCREEIEEKEGKKRVKFSLCLSLSPPPPISIMRVSVFVLNGERAVSASETFVSLCVLYICEGHAELAVPLL
ncbi:hypothetical protein LZ31DRAFT_79104 [Colletotrichum somersetense]|nr:hypothetical protein LZ31DRAFT_79104 [Colletotrichum somersetense]